MWGAIAGFVTWLLGKLFAKPAAPTPDAVIVSEAPAVARQAGADEAALVQAQSTIKTQEAQRVQENHAAAAVGTAQRRVVQESPAQLDADPDAHYRD